MLSMSMTFDARAVTVAIQQGPVRVGRAIERGVRDIAAKLRQAVVVDQLSGQALHARTGQLRRAVRDTVTVTATSATARVEIDPSRAKYGAIHEVGGTITAKNGGYLAIPLEPVRTAAGVPRFTARDVMSSPSSFGYKHCFIAKGVIFGLRVGAVKDRTGMVGTEALFALKRSVRMPERAPLKKALAASRAWISARVNQAAAEAAQQIGGA